MRDEELKAPLALLLVYWCIGVLGAGLELCIAGLKSRLLSIASLSDAPKLFTIHHSPFTIRKRSFRFRFLTPHSSLLTSLILSDKESK